MKVLRRKRHALQRHRWLKDMHCVRREPCKVLIFIATNVVLQMFHPPTLARSRL
jgi:hypothetical protein